MHKQLLANQAKSKDQIRLVEKNTFIDLIDDIEPELDIYTEGWNSKAVNPFKQSEVPDSKVIDVTGYFMPVPGRVTSNYGYRARFGRMHKGIDWACPVGTSIMASCGGTVVQAGWFGGYGNCITLRHPDGRQTRYGHLSRILVKTGQSVKQGEKIGLSGNTGRSTGPHVHFEIIINGSQVNPLNYLD